MTSAVEIVNDALQKIGEEAITSLSDNSDRARAANRIFTKELRAELRAHPWNCAVKRVQLAALSDAPLFGFAYQYQLPSDCVRILPDALVTDWQVEGRKLLTDDGGPLDVRYVYEITDPNEMDPLFVDALSSRLALRLCERLTQSSTKRELAEKDYRRALQEARRVNAFEKIAQSPPTDPWIIARL
jgi:hypothetical protein